MSYRVVRAMDCFNPHSLAVAPEGMKKLATLLLVLLAKRRILTEDEADKAGKQYVEFVDRVLPLVRPEFKDFDTRKHRLDELYFSTIGNNYDYTVL